MSADLCGALQISFLWQRVKEKLRCPIDETLWNGDYNELNEFVSTRTWEKNKIG